jgi:hypothetical protein
VVLGIGHALVAVELVHAVERRPGHGTWDTGVV